jgi:hypothetical protein
MMKGEAEKLPFFFFFLLFGIAPKSNHHEVAAKLKKSRL